MRSILCLLWLSTLAYAEDPAAMGAHAVVETGYDFGPTAWSDPVSIERCGFSARVYHPQDLDAGPYPLLLILHGRHQGVYDPETGNAGNAWPPPSGWLPLPNKDGYDWIARPMASRGCIVVSLSANALTSFDTFYPASGDAIRQRLARAHLRLWQRLASEDVPPFGDRFNGAIDLQRVALLGHSRGGGVMARLARQLVDEGEVGVAAVALLAAVDYPRVELPSTVPAAMLMGQLDGDVSSLESVHYFDDGRWNAAAARYLALLDGANHNFFNRYWDPDEFTAGAKNDDRFRPSFAISGSAQRAAAGSWFAAFLRQHLLGDARWQDTLIGEAALPNGVACRRSWQPPADQRRAINSARTIEHRTINDRGGAVSSSGALTAEIIGGGHPLPDTVLSEHQLYREIHWSGNQSYFSLAPGLRQHRLRWSADDAVWRNALPSGERDASAHAWLQLRLGVNFESNANTADQDQDLSLRLIDTEGESATVRVSDHSDAAMWPVGTELAGTLQYYHYMPRLALYQARVPLSAFTGVDRARLASVEVVCDRRESGEVVLVDLALAGDGDRPPGADGIVLDNATPTLGDPVQAGISPSDPDGDPITVTWDWGDGSDASGTTAAHTYTAASVYVITATLLTARADVRLQRAVTVTPAGGNSAPTCSGFADVQLAQGGAAGSIPFTIGDSDGPVSRLRVWATSSDVELIDRPGLLVGGSGSDRSLSVQPYSGRSGSATISVHVSDGMSTTTRTFTLTVAAATAPPIMQWSLYAYLAEENAYNTGPRDNERWFEQDATPQLTIDITDTDTPVYVDGEWVDAITTTVESSDEDLLPASAVTFARRENSTNVYDVDLTLPADKTGALTLTFSAEDDTGNTDSVTMLLHIVAPGNQAPVITSAAAVPDPVVMRSGIDLVVDANDPDDGPAPLRTFWLLAGIPSGFEAETLGWRSAPSGGEAGARASFTTASLQALVDGEYSFTVEVYDGLASAAEDLTVTVDNDTDTLLAWWPLDETAGRRHDRWIHNVHLSPTGAVHRRRGTIGRAAGFTGAGALAADDRANSGLAIGDALTIALWCRPLAADGRRTLIAKHRDDAPGWALRLDAGRPQFLLHDGTGAAHLLTAPGALPPDTWSHVVAVYDASTTSTSLWVDGDQVASSAAAPAALATATAGLLIGAAGTAEAPADAYAGAIDAVSLHQAALDADRIAALYAAGNADQPPLVSWVTPTSQQAFASGGDVEIELAAVDPEGEAVTVTLYRIDSQLQNGLRTTVLATMTEAPYRWTWNAPADGSHTLVALASDGTAHSVTDWRFLHVGAPLQLLPLETLRSVLLHALGSAWLWEEADGAGTVVPHAAGSDFRLLPATADHRFVPVPSGAQ